MDPQAANVNKHDDSNELRDKIVINGVYPLVSGLAFGLGWLGTFYLLKRNFQAS
jgi:hypothetical protein